MRHGRFKQHLLALLGSHRKCHYLKHDPGREGILHSSGFGAVDGHVGLAVRRPPQFCHVSAIEGLRVGGCKFPGDVGGPKGTKEAGHTSVGSEYRYSVPTCSAVAGG